MILPNVIKSCGDESWDLLADRVIQDVILQIINESGECNLMLTGGHTVGSLYERWSNNINFPFDKIKFWFGDERCVPPNSTESNYNMVKNTLFNGDDNQYLVNRIFAESKNTDAAALDYEKKLPKSLDVILFSVGLDGHIASLFPYSDILVENKRMVLPSVGPLEPINRITITPLVIENAKNIILLARGKSKGLVLRNSVSGEYTYMDMPVCLLNSGTWILDAEAAEVTLGNIQ